MPLFEWEEPSLCGDAPEPCEIKPRVASGKSLVVSDSTSNCNSDLIANEYPAIAVASSFSNTDLRSGSSSNRIKLPLLMEQLDGAVPSLVTKRGDGTIVAWTHEPFCKQKRIVVLPNGGIIAIVDSNNNLFENICEGTYDSSSHVALGRSFIDCDGVRRFSLVFTSKADFAGAIFSDITSLDIDGFLAANTLDISGTASVGSLTVGGGASINGILTASFSENIPAINSDTGETITLSVPGAAVGDTVALGWQYGFADGVVLQNFYVSAADTVIIKLWKHGAGASGPMAAMGIYVTVFKF